MTDLHGHYFDDLSVGMTESISKTVTEEDITKFAEVSTDNNPLHLDEDFAAGTPFKSRIAHGMLSVSFISAIFGTKLPGPGCIYMSQNVRFLAPVRIGDTVEARVTVTELMPEKNRAAFQTQCHVGETMVVDGDALVMVPARPA